ncbi:MAG: hypothetical protein QW265_03960 [Candidatus Bathyarchaeia archaeon]
MNKKCSKCSYRGITLLRMEIFNRGTLSVHEKAHRRITALCKNCGEIILEEEVKCPNCGKRNVKACLSKRSGSRENFEGIDYLLRCKNCGFIWKIHFRNETLKRNKLGLNILAKR